MPITDSLIAWTARWITTGMSLLDGEKKLKKVKEETAAAQN